MLNVRKIALLLMLVGASLGAHATVVVGVDPQKNWIGFMNWWDLPANGGGFAGQDFWSPVDLGAQFSGSTLTLTPNTSIDRDVPNDLYWWKADGSSNKIMGANLLVIDDTLVGQDIVFSGMVLSNTLASGYKSSAFVRAFNANYSVLLSSNEVLLSDGMAFQVSYQSSSVTDAHIQYGFDTIGPNARIGNALGSVVIAVPEPATWAMFAVGLLGVGASRRRGRSFECWTNPRHAG